MRFQDELTKISVKSCKSKCIKHSLGFFFSSTVAFLRWQLDIQQTKSTSKHLKHHN